MPEEYYAVRFIQGTEMDGYQPDQLSVICSFASLRPSLSDQDSFGCHLRMRLAFDQAHFIKSRNGGSL